MGGGTFPSDPLFGLLFGTFGAKCLDGNCDQNIEKNNQCGFFHVFSYFVF